MLFYGVCYILVISIPKFKEIKYIDMSVSKSSLDYVSMISRMSHWTGVASSISVL